VALFVFGRAATLGVKCNARPRAAAGVRGLQGQRMRGVVSVRGEGRDVSAQYEGRDEMCPVSTRVVSGPGVERAAGGRRYACYPSLQLTDDTQRTSITNDGYDEAQLRDKAQVPPRARVRPSRLGVLSDRPRDPRL